MRIVHLSSHHKALDVRIFQKECRTLAGAGYQVHLVIPEPPSASLDGVTFHPFQPPPGRGWRPGRVGKRLACMYRQAAALRGQVYHFHDPELIPVGVLLKRRGAKVVYDVHEETVQEPLMLEQHQPWQARLKSWAWRALEDLARKTLDAFVCATPHIARSFPGRRTFLVRNYPLLAEFSPAPPPPTPPPPHPGRPPHLVYVGAISAIRGIREMVQALSLLPEALGVRLVLAGEFASAGLRAEVERLPGWDRVDYRGWLSRPAIREVLGRARAGLVLLHPEVGHLESLPIKMFEYMAAGLPVIASDFPLWRAILTEASCGLTVNPLDPAAVARAIRQLLDEPATAEQMGRHGQAAVAQRYNWETESRQLLDLYRHLAA